MLWSDLLKGQNTLVLNILHVLRGMNDHQKAIATTTAATAVPCSFPRAGCLPDLRVCIRAEESMRKNAGAYLLEFKSKFHLEHACVACVCSLVMFKCISAASVTINEKVKVESCVLC